MGPTAPAGKPTTAGAIVAAALFLLAFPAVASAATFTVNSNANGGDANLADGACDSDAATPNEQCTLRAAIQQSNQSAGTPDSIHFSLPAPVIHVSGTALPTITDPVTIDGTTQGFNNQNKILIGGAAFATGSGVNGLDISAGSTIVRDLAIFNFPGYGVRLRTNGANTLEGNWVGTSDGVAAAPNGNGGINVESGAGNVIGGPGTIGTTGEPRGNVLSGNQLSHVQVGSSASATTIQSNRIGTNQYGNQAIPANANGIKLDGNGTQIGGDGAGEGNVISGGNSWGILVQGGDANVIEGNIVGLDAAGNTDISTNTNVGIQLSANSLNNVIGGDTAAEGNVISGNGVGLVIGQAATGTEVGANRIGTDASGTLDRGNASHGITIGAGPNTIGGPTAAQGNVISGNDGDGVQLLATGTQPVSNTIRNNRIGTDAPGTAPLGNAGTGLRIGAGAGTVVQENTIGANGFGTSAAPTTNPGIQVTSGAHTIAENGIGTDLTATAQLGNAGDGVRIGSSGNTVGDNGIAHNGDDGIFVSGGTGNDLAGNQMWNNGAAAGDLAIDLGGAGVTPNDPAPDADAGANNLQNFPVLTQAEIVGSNTYVEGTLTSAPNTTYEIALYRNAEGCDDGGHGEAQQHLESFNVTTNGAGTAGFTRNLSTQYPTGTVLTAMATDPANNSSELSACRSVQAPAQVSINQIEVSEGVGDATFTATLDRPTSQTVTVPYSTSNGSAQAPGDYTASTGTVTFAPGDTSETFTVAVNDDSIDERDRETFFVTLGTPTNAVIGDGSGVAGIADNDEPPTISIADTSVVEGDTDDREANFTITLDEPSEQRVDGYIETTDGTATAPADYEERRESFRIEPGVTSVTVPVFVLGDTIDEGSGETFNVLLDDVARAQMGDGQAVGTITDDDPEPAVSIGDVSVDEGNDGPRDAIFMVTLNRTSSQTVSVDFATADGSAGSPGDYEAKSGTLTFAPGETSKTATTTVNGDTTDEPDETFSLNASNPSGVTLGDGTGTATIADDDETPRRTPPDEPKPDEPKPPKPPETPPCADKAKPAATLSKRGVKIRRGRLTLSGTAVDTAGDCPSGVRRVQVSLAKVAGRSGVNCRFVRKQNRFSLTRPQSCRRPVLFTATGTGRWSAAFKLKLAPGKYRAQARAVDAAGNKETPKKGRSIVFFTVR